jgi:hypothetical protein
MNEKCNYNCIHRKRGEYCGDRTYVQFCECTDERLPLIDDCYYNKTDACVAENFELTNYDIYEIDFLVRLADDVRKINRYVELIRAVELPTLQQPETTIKLKRLLQQIQQLTEPINYQQRG